MLHGKLRQLESSQLLVHNFEADHKEVNFDSEMTSGVFQLQGFEFDDLSNQRFTFPAQVFGV